MNYEKLVRKLVAGPSEKSVDTPAIATRRKFRAQGGPVSGFARIFGSAKAGDIAATAITAERLAGVGRDGEFAEQNAHQQESARQRRQDNLERVERFNEQHEQGAVEDQEFFEEQESTPVEERRHSRPVGLEAVNQEYAKRRGYQLPHVS